MTAPMNLLFLNGVESKIGDKKPGHEGRVQGSGETAEHQLRMAGAVSGSPLLM